MTGKQTFFLLHCCNLRYFKTISRIDIWCLNAKWRIIFINWNEVLQDADGPPDRNKMNPLHILFDKN